uniref:Uncharacterized protein n=1 Tax=Anguilla anguilla TaxID=7936 RepID=A0A0E9WZN7_ANGAN
MSTVLPTDMAIFTFNCLRVARERSETTGQLTGRTKPITNESPKAGTNPLTTEPSVTSLE